MKTMSEKPEQMPDNVTDRPLVTFALFAYNQEKYIREAIEGAFAQTYEPLEIILSDDCSDDRTFEIMQKMAQDYSGPHQVRVRQNQFNSGTFNHLLQIVDETYGQLIILAAGDDISYSNRSDELVKIWLMTNSAGVYSSYELINEHGAKIDPITEPIGDAEVCRWFNFDNDFEFIGGATSAYDRRIFAGLRLSEQKLFMEDAVLTTVINMNPDEKLSIVEKPLIGYRQHEASWSNTGKQPITAHEIRNFEKKIAYAASSYISLCEYVSIYISDEHLTDQQRFAFRKAVEATQRFARLKGSVFSEPLLRRVFLIFLCRDLREFRFLAPRILGPRLFSSAKALLFRLGVRSI